MVRSLYPLAGAAEGSGTAVSLAQNPSFAEADSKRRSRQEQDLTADSPQPERRYELAVS